MGYAVALVITLAVLFPVVWPLWWALASLGEPHRAHPHRHGLPS